MLLQRLEVKSSGLFHFGGGGGLREEEGREEGGRRGRRKYRLTGSLLTRRVKPNVLLAFLSMLTEKERFTLQQMISAG